MEDDFQKPLYADYKKYTRFFFWRVPVRSNDRQYELADRPMIIFGLVLLFLCSYTILRNFPLNFVADIGGVFVWLLMFPYINRFVYRFGRFHVKWEDWTEHPGEEQANENCDRWGELLDTDENKRVAKKSRRAFLIFFASLAAATALYCYLGYGLSYMRVYSWHRGEIEKIAETAQKYDSVTIDDDYEFFDTGYRACSQPEMAEADARELKQAFKALRWEYVGFILWSGEALHVSFWGGLAHCELCWYPEEKTVEQVKRLNPEEQVTQLDEHWWYVR